MDQGNANREETCMFSTAKGDPIHLSQAALAKAKQWLVEALKETEGLDPALTESTNDSGLGTGVESSLKRKRLDPGPDSAMQKRQNQQNTPPKLKEESSGLAPVRTVPNNQDSTAAAKDTGVPEAQANSSDNQDLGSRLGKLSARLKFSCSLDAGRSSPILRRKDWEPPGLEQKRATAIEKQLEIIQSKRTCGSVPVVTGSLFEKKRKKESSSSRSSIKRHTYHPLPEQYKITPVQAKECKFHCLRQSGLPRVSVETNDGAELILGKGGLVSLSEIRRTFLATPGVSPDAVTEKWIEHHYVSIVYKFLFKRHNNRNNGVSGARDLKPLDILDELKYRYDREVGRSERSCLSLILAKEQPASRRIVLRVLEIRLKDDCAVPSEQGSPAAGYLLLTDGWYHIKARPDSPMRKRIKSRQLYEGLKLVVHGAELHNSDTACSPLEVPEEAYLSLKSNSTRVAAFGEKLGNHSLPGPIKKELHDVQERGGIVGRLVVGVVKVYPNLYREQLLNGDLYAYRHKVVEERLAKRHEEKRRSVLEEFYERFVRTIHIEEKERSRFDVDAVQLEAVKLKRAYNELLEERAVTTVDLRTALKRYQSAESSYKKALLDALPEKLPPVRDTQEVLYVRVTEEQATAILVIPLPHQNSIWIEEGRFIEVTNVVPESSLSHDTDHCGGTLRLVTSEDSELNWVNIGSRVPVISRSITEIQEIAADVEKFQPEYHEFDTVGIVVAVLGKSHATSSDVVCLACPDKEDLDQIYYLRLIFPSGVGSNCHEETIVIGSALGCENLGWLPLDKDGLARTGAYCLPQTVFHKDPPEHTKIAAALEPLNALVQDRLAFAARAMSHAAGQQLQTCPAFGIFHTDWCSEDDA